jgi:hypothetical protein
VKAFWMLGVEPVEECDVGQAWPGNFIVSMTEREKIS